jgi:hypothetical protein
VHLYRHEGTLTEADEAGESRLPDHLVWRAEDASVLGARVAARGWAVLIGGLWKLTAAGRERARMALNQPSF